jgi:ubiquinone/menaquinone biosynthesis C-methylase UbiE
MIDATHDVSVSAATASDQYKHRAREQWEANPCGVHVARGIEFGSREYFDVIADYRYRVYAPWMKRTICFDKYRGARVLEIGCGTGTDLAEFARAGAIVTGVDLTARGIEIARSRFQVYGLSGEFAIGDAEDLSFPDESFDVVYSFGVLHHTPNTERAVEEIHRVLRPGGRAIVMLYNKSSLYYWGSVILKRGVFGGRLLREGAADIMSRVVEYTETDGRPLVKVFTRSQVRHLFRAFRDCCVSVDQLTRQDLGPAGRLLPDAIMQWLAHNFGFNLLISATR